MPRSWTCPSGLLILMATLLICGVAAADAARLPEDAAAVQAGMNRVIAFLDAPGYAKSTPRGEHVVLAYQLAQHREPTPEEFIVLSELYGGTGFTRSAILAMALRGTGTETTWDQCREFLQTTKEKDFQGSAETRDIAERLTQTCAAQIAEKMSLKGPYALPTGSAEKAPAAVPNEEYNVYYGYLHAHSGLSLDAPGSTPLEAYTYARDEGHLDYFSLTDHAEFLVIWPWDHKWQQLKDAAQETYAPGQFVTFWGFEWSNPVLGHINVLNSTDMTSCLEHFWLPEFYFWLSGRPGTFALFNHPGLYNALGIELRHLQHFGEVTDQMVGIEVSNTNDGFDRYYYSGSWDSDISYWDTGNLKGWRLGPVIGQDNHQADWGTMNSFRTAVLAKELTREAIMDAYENRRFYATENNGLHLDFRCAGYPMGSRLQNMPRTFKVKASTSAGEAFEQVRLFRDGVLLQTQTVAGNPIEAEFSDAGTSGGSYYYVIVTETVDTDGNGRNDEAISAPIWLDETQTAPPACGTLGLGVSGYSGKGGYGDWMALFLTLTLLVAGRKLRAFSGSGLKAH